MDTRALPSFQKGQHSVTRGAHFLYETIQDALNEKRGALVGRHGTSELEFVLNPKRVNGHNLLRAGIWPIESESLREWRKAYLDASKEADVFAAGWYEPLAKAELELLDEIAPEQIHIPLRSLEPYYVEPEQAWTRALAGRRVCVVSAFAKTMMKQCARAEQIWPTKSEAFLPISTKWSFVRSYFCPPIAGRPDCEWPQCVSWRDAVSYMETEVLKTIPEIVLIGCGGLAMPLAARLKRRDIVCIVLGGAIQNLFGIKGERWRTHSVIGAFWNDAWVAPSAEETPDAVATIEGGCYWINH